MIPYFGGKSYLANWIISNFPSDYQAHSYCEVFGGGGWVLFKKEPSNLEIYNDLNEDLVNLFRIIRDNYRMVYHHANWSLHSRAMFEEAKVKLSNERCLSDVEHAISFALHKIQSFSAGGSTWAYRVSGERPFSGKWLPFLKRMELINARLKKVQIECLDFEKIIRKYDSPNTLFYLDPPYLDHENYYKTKKVDFTQNDHERLAQILKQIKGKFALSYYDHGFVRSHYKGFKIISKQMPKYSIRSFGKNAKHHKPLGKELLILNY